MSGRRLRTILDWAALIIVKFEFSRFFILRESIAAHVFYRAGGSRLTRVHTAAQADILLLEAAAFGAFHVDLVLDAFARRFTLHGAAQIGLLLHQGAVIR